MLPALRRPAEDPGGDHVVLRTAEQEGEIGGVIDGEPRSERRPVGEKHTQCAERAAALRLVEIPLGGEIRVGAGGSADDCQQWRDPLEDLPATLGP